MSVRVTFYKVVKISLLFHYHKNNLNKVIKVLYFLYYDGHLTCGSQI